MSNPFRAIAKAFKAVVKTVKKVALPALAIGAAILTGGAALGVLPALGAGGLGLTPGLAAVISSAGTGALMGGATSLLTGGNIIKGMTTGGVLGAATGGIGQMMKGGAAVGSAATNGAKAAGTIANGVDEIVVNGGKAFGLGSAASTALPGIAAFSGQSAVQPQTNDVVASVASPAPVNAAAPSAIAQPVASPGGGGILGFMNKNPLVAAGLIQGIGSGISANATAKEARRAQEDEQKRIAANYAGSGNFFSPVQITQPNRPAQRVVWDIDPVTGNPYRRVENG